MNLEKYHDFEKNHEFETVQKTKKITNLNFFHTF